jgi:VanZ family protein
MSGLPAPAAPAVVPAPAPARRLRLTAAVLALAWAALVFYLSSKSDPLPFSVSTFPGEDKVLHALAYGVLGALVALSAAGPRFPGRRAVLLAAALASLYGVTDELHQSFVPGRDTSAGDWVADTLGAATGAALAVAALRRRGRAR